MPIFNPNGKDQNNSILTQTVKLGFFHTGLQN